jgi:hypothetical protein
MAGADSRLELLANQRFKCGHSQPRRLTFAAQSDMADWWPKVLETYLQPAEKIST